MCMLGIYTLDQFRIIIVHIHITRTYVHYLVHAGHATLLIIIITAFFSVFQGFTQTYSAHVNEEYASANSRATNLPYNKARNN